MNSKEETYETVRLTVEYRGRRYTAIRKLSTRALQGDINPPNHYANLHVKEIAAAAQNIMFQALFKEKRWG